MIFLQKMIDYFLALPWQSIFEAITLIVTIFQFLSGVLACRPFVRNKTTGEASALPFICSFVMCGIWYFYGVLIEDDFQIIVNLIGCALFLSYVIVFYKYASKRKEVNRQLLYCGVLNIILYGYLFHQEDLLRQQNITGTIACGLTLVAIAAPLDKLYYVTKVKSTECLPYHMILMSFVVSVLWLEYGIVKQDSFLILPNVFGILLAALQLSLFLIYPNTPVPRAGKTLMA